MDNLPNQADLQAASGFLRQNVSLVPDVAVVLEEKKQLSLLCLTLPLGHGGSGRTHILACLVSVLCILPCLHGYWKEP